MNGMHTTVYLRWRGSHHRVYFKKGWIPCVGEVLFASWIERANPERRVGPPDINAWPLEDGEKSDRDFILIREDVEMDGCMVFDVASIHRAREAVTAIARELHQIRRILAEDFAQDNPVLSEMLKRQHLSSLEAGRLKGVQEALAFLNSCIDRSGWHTLSQRVVLEDVTERMRRKLIEEKEKA